MARARRRRPAGPIGIAGIMVCVGVMIGFNLAGKFSLALFIVMPLVCSAFIAAGWIEARRRRGDRGEEP